MTAAAAAAATHGINWRVATRGRLSYTLGAPARAGRAPFASMVCVYRPGLAAPAGGRAQLLFPFLPRTR